MQNNVAAALTFEIHEKGKPIRELTFKQFIIKIGRLSSANIRLEEEQVSRMHAVIELTDKGIHIIDLGSETGTFVLGQRIIRCELHNGDELLIGSTKIIIRLAQN